MVNEYLELTDWRRRVAAMFAEWRLTSSTDPVAATTTFRSAKDRLFAEHPQSPLLPDRRATFSGLPYWPYDPAYRMVVTLEPADGVGGPHEEATPGPLGLGTIALPSSGPGAIAFRRIGRVRLTGPLEGHRLSVFWKFEGYGGGLFLPFRDATSGTETYGAGRYALDTIKSADHGAPAKESASDGRSPTAGRDPTASRAAGAEGAPAKESARTLLIDFNLAFHPSCAYDPRWSCPLSPPENTLAVPVPVGEQLLG